MLKSIFRAPRAAYRLFLPEVKRLFSLQSDTDEISTVEVIKANVEFSGANLWILILAIFVASVGLNVNSTAVIIGAMLISPLMGPIVGAGLALGTNDFDLLKRSLRNLGVATAISVVTSAVYFTLSPLSVAQSELLARTTPTLYDVLIALFGGATGIIAGSRRERGNAVAGVAIATALMPPLCTAGFGLARLDLSFLLGALYLYFINSVFICWATYLVVRLLKFKKVSFVERAVERRVHFYMTVFAFLTMVPSVYTGYVTVTKALLSSSAQKFVREVIRFDNSKVVESSFDWGDHPKIEVSVLGVPLTPEQKEEVMAKLPRYGLSQVELVIHDAGASVANEMEKRLDSKMKSSFLGQLYEQHEFSMKDKDKKIELLEREVLRYKESEKVTADLAHEMRGISDRILSLSYGPLPCFDPEGKNIPSQPLVVVQWRGKPASREKGLVDQYLKVRLGNAAVVHRNL